MWSAARSAAAAGSKRGGVILGHDFARVRKQAEDARDHVLTKAGVTDPGHWLPEVYAAPEE